MVLSNETARLFTGLIPIRRFDSGRVKSDFNPSGLQPILRKVSSELLLDLKERIRSAQVKAAFAVSKELNLLDFEIGMHISNQQELHGWGEKVLDRIAFDLQSSFPGIQGFSRRSLYRMRAFYNAYKREGEFVSQVATQIPWFHNVVVFERFTVEYALKNTSTPIGVAEFLTSLPEIFIDSLPKVQQLEAELERREGNET